MKPTPPIHELRRRLARLHAALNDGCEQYARQSLAIQKIEAERGDTVRDVNEILDEVERSNAALAEAGVEPPPIPADMPELFAAIMRGRASGETAARLESKALPRTDDGAGLN